MPVTRSCSTDTLGLTLSISAGQRLRYTFGGNSAVLWRLVDGAGAVLAASPAPEVREWPVAGDPHNGTHVIHSVGMAFGAADTLTWRVDVLDAAGTVLQTIKDCKYLGGATPSQFFDALSIGLA